MRLFSMAVIFGLMTAGAVQAAPITFNFTGTVTGTPTGVFIGQGSAVTGSLTFDTGLLDSFPSNGTSDFFGSSEPGNTGFVFSMSVTNGAITRSYSATDNSVTFLQQLDSSGGELWRFRVFPSNDESTEILLFADNGLYGSGVSNLTDMPVDPTTLNLSAVTNQTNFLVAPDGQIIFNVLSFSPVTPMSVPAPAGLPILGTGLLAVGLIRRRVKGRVA